MTMAISSNKPNFQVQLKHLQYLTSLQNNLSKIKFHQTLTKKKMVMCLKKMLLQTTSKEVRLKTKVVIMKEATQKKKITVKAMEMFLMVTMELNQEFQLASFSNLTTVE